MSRTSSLPISKKELLYVAVALLALYGVLPQLGAFHSSLSVLTHLSYVPASLAVGLSGLTYLAAAGTYYWLAFKPLHFWTTTLVQVASMFVNRLLPAGIGSLGANFAYLRHRRHTIAQASAVVTVNNGMGIVGHNLLLVMGLLLYRNHLPPIHTGGLAHILNRTTILLATLLIVIGACIWLRRKARRVLWRIVRQLAHYRQRPHRLLLALLTSVCLTLCNVGALHACLIAVHVHLAFLAVLLVFTLGIALGTATPTPGGLGGFEAGLVAGLVAFRVASAEALAAVLLYRLITYWLALVTGGIAFTAAEQRGYFS